MIYFSSNEAARLLGITRQRLGVLLRSGRIQGSFNAGNHTGWQIPREALLLPILSKHKGKRIGVEINEEIKPGPRLKVGRPRNIIST